MRGLENQLRAENEANDDLTEQLEQAYKAGFKTRQENQTLTDKNRVLQQRTSELEEKVKQLEAAAKESQK